MVKCMVVVLMPIFASRPSVFMNSSRVSPCLGSCSCHGVLLMPIFASRPSVFINSSRVSPYLGYCSCHGVLLMLILLRNNATAKTRMALNPKMSVRA